MVFQDDTWGHLTYNNSVIETLQILAAFACILPFIPTTWPDYLVKLLGLPIFVEFDGVGKSKGKWPSKQKGHTSDGTLWKCIVLDNNTKLVK